MNEEYDRLPPQNLVKLFALNLEPAKFIVWQDGNPLINARSKTKILGELYEDKNGSHIRVSLDNPDLSRYIKKEFVFDSAITSTDRLYLASIPNESDQDNMGINFLRESLGVTDPHKTFDLDEPYCCSIYFRNEWIVKITFSIARVKRLVEFYFE